MIEPIRFKSYIFILEAFETKPTNIQLLNTTLSFAKRQGYYLDCKMKPNYLNKKYTISLHWY